MVAWPGWPKINQRPKMVQVTVEEFRKLKNRVLNLETSHSNLKKANSKLEGENKMLKEIAKLAVEETQGLRRETNFLRTKLNCVNYHCDGINQYGRRENADWNRVPEKDGEETEKEVMEAVINRANYCLSKDTRFEGIVVEPSDIQRVHRIGRKKESTDGITPKPRKIICRFKSYKLRQKIILSKRHLKTHPTYKDSFITENLTPFRAKLLWYVKNKCDGRFVKAHTRDGNIRVQLREAQGDDDDWHYIRSPEDLFKFNVDFDFKLFNKDYFQFEVYDTIKPASTFNQFEELLKCDEEGDT